MLFHLVCWAPRADVFVSHNDQQSWWRGLKDLRQASRYGYVDVTNDHVVCLLAEERMMVVQFYVEWVKWDAEPHLIYMSMLTTSAAYSIQLPCKPFRNTLKHKARWKVAWLWVCFLWSVFVYVSMSRWWTDSSIPRLALAEETLMNKYAQVCVCVYVCLQKWSYMIFVQKRDFF